MIEVQAPGLFTTVQDRGRPGYYAMGMPPSGALDLYSHDVGNILVGNRADAAGLEITFMGPKLRFLQASVIAVTGAEIGVSLGGSPAPQWTAIAVEAGQLLEFGPMRSGARAYLAVQGGIEVPLVMGSRSTYALSRIGGFQGRTLAAGDALDVGGLRTSTRDVRLGVEVPEDLRPGHHDQQVLRVVGGLCDHRLTQDAVDRLYGSDYSVTPEANRTGYRFAGPALTFVDREPPFGAGDDPSNVVNLGYPIGSIQSPSGSELICLLRDAVTGGGYATLGTVISADLDVLAQMKLPDTARFEPVTLEIALRERHVRRARLARVAETVTA
jgi:biotin-dependent carboxylase-like uncharacterized protein